MIRLVAGNSDILWYAFYRGYIYMNKYYLGIVCYGLRTKCIANIDRSSRGVERTSVVGHRRLLWQLSLRARTDSLAHVRWIISIGYYTRTSKTRQTRMTNPPYTEKSYVSARVMEILTKIDNNIHIYITVSIIVNKVAHRTLGNLMEFF